MTGLVDWSAIEDRTRFMRGVSHFNNPDDIIETAAASFRLDKWKNQPHHVEVFIEKDALVGVIESICRKLDVTYASCRGYMSLSTMWETAQRLKWHTTIGKQITIVHLGDHDPSGVHMSQDIESRLSLFMGHKAAKKLSVKKPYCVEHGSNRAIQSSA